MPRSTAFHVSVENYNQLLCLSITCDLWSSRCIMQNAGYAAVNLVVDLMGNKCDISKVMFLNCDRWISISFFVFCFYVFRCPLK